MTDLSTPGHISVNTGWNLAPAPVSISFEDLEADRESSWVGYHTPFSTTSFRNPQSYMKYYLSVEGQSQNRNIIDQWVSPGWSDKNSNRNVTWTNELIHFVLDNSIPMIYDLMDDDRTIYKEVVRAALAQKQARLEGNHDNIWGEGLDDYSYIMSTIAVTTEVKRLLPTEGVRWLFMRVEVKSILNDRLDHHIILTSQEGDLVAVSNQVAQIIPIEGKKAKIPRL